jgi:hypothetical protein
VDYGTKRISAMIGNRFYEKLLKVNSENELLLDEVFKKNIREGEEALMLAVLRNAVEFFQMYALAKDKKGKELFREAQEWILERNSDWFFSFENICESLALDPNYVRQGLLRWKEAKRKRYAGAKIYSPAVRKKPKKSPSAKRSHCRASA